MSNLIEFPSKPDYTGKYIAVSPESPASKFQCRGFVVFRNKPMVVGPDADMMAIQAGLLDGRLLELTPSAVIKSANATLNPTSEEDTDLKVFILQTKEGIILLTPENPEQAEQIEKELQETGQLNLDHYPNVKKSKVVQPHLTGISITELEPEDGKQPNDSQCDSSA